MKSGRTAVRRKSPGTLRAAEIRARCNKLTEAERREFRDKGMRLYNECQPNYGTLMAISTSVWSEGCQLEIL